MSEVNYRQQWAEGEIEAGTLLDAIDALATELQARRVQVDTLTEWYANALNELGACAAALPGISYMDLPDGGSPTVAEQVARMAAECERLRECLSKANGQTEHFERNWYLVSDERDAALAELAALKGGQGAATNRKTWSPAATGFSCLHCGTARAYHEMQTFCPTGPAFASGSSSAKPVAQPAQASAWVAGRYTCIGKGGSYLRVGTSIGAGDNRGEIVEVYRDESNGQLYHRDTENFFVRMTAAPTPGASDGKGGDHE